jgi:hypothetical protein
MLDAAHYTKNPTTVVLLPMMMMEGMEVAGTILHHLVVHSSHVRTTYYVTYVYYYFHISLIVDLIFAGKADFTHTTQDHIMVHHNLIG